MNLRVSVVPVACGCAPVEGLLAMPAEIRAEDDDVIEIGDVYAVGARCPVRSTADAPAAIDLIGGEDFTDQGVTDRPLEPEESVTFTVGAVAEAGPFSVTADYYRIDVEGRLAPSATKGLTDAEKAMIGDSGCVPAADARNFRHFTDGLDTRTQGVDLVASVDLPAVAPALEAGETELVFVGNWTRTTVTKYDPEALDPADPNTGVRTGQRIVQLEDALPKVRFNATLRHEQARWSAFARLNYFGSYSEYHADETGWLFHPGSEITLDVEGSYKPMPGVELSLGAENVLDNFPDENPFAKDFGSKYPESSPMGFAGGFYYARARYVF